jgi:hypothetical protein
MLPFFSPLNMTIIMPNEPIRRPMLGRSQTWVRQE